MFKNCLNPMLHVGKIQSKRVRELLGTIVQLRYYILSNIVDKGKDGIKLNKSKPTPHRW